MKLLMFVYISASKNFLISFSLPIAWITANTCWWRPITCCRVLAAAAAASCELSSADKIGSIDAPTKQELGVAEDWVLVLPKSSCRRAEGSTLLLQTAHT